MGFQIEAIEEVIVTEMVVTSDMSEPVQVVFQGPSQQNSLLPGLDESRVDHSINYFTSHKTLLVLFEAVLAVLDIGQMHKLMCLFHEQLLVVGARGERQAILFRDSVKESFVLEEVTARNMRKEAEFFFQSSSNGYRFGTSTGHTSFNHGVDCFGSDKNIAVGQSSVSSALDVKDAEEGIGMLGNFCLFEHRRRAEFWVSFVCLRLLWKQSGCCVVVGWNFVEQGEQRSLSLARAGM